MAAAVAVVGMPGIAAGTMGIIASMSPIVPEAASAKGDAPSGGRHGAAGSAEVSSGLFPCCEGGGLEMLVTCKE